MLKLLTAGLLAGAFTSTALCDGVDFQWQGQLAPGQLLEVRGVDGSIRAVGTSGNNASVTVRKTGQTNDPGGVSIQVVPFEGGVIVCALYPDDGVRPPNVCNPPGMDIYLSAN